MNMTPTVIYKKSTGEIISTGGMQFEPEHKDAQISAALAPWGDEYAITEGPASKELHYVAMVDGEPVLAGKPILHVAIDKTEIAADGEDIATLTGLPNPCEIIIDDDDPLTPTSIVEVTGGGFTFSTEDPGPYSFEVRGRFPFLPWKTVVTAT